MAKQKAPRNWIIILINPARQGSTFNFVSPPGSGGPEVHLLYLSKAFPQSRVRKRNRLRVISSLPNVNCKA
ncbi:hypothetical protein EUGRSUZ_K00014 [Eucalyptus grandis]|nr:hypothetical protein EUGRSUZ_K00014 [Eucalyptus grandis]